MSKKLEVYKPEIIAYKTSHYGNSDLIIHFSDVYSKVCAKLGMKFDFNSLQIVKNINKDNNLFCDYTGYLRKYIFNSRNINRKLLNNSRSGRTNQTQKTKSLLNVMKMYGTLYKTCNVTYDISKSYNIYHVGKMMLDSNNKEYEINKTFNTLCFLSCSLDIIDSFFHELENPFIYEIQVNITQPVFFLFENIEQLEILLPPNTELYVINIEKMTYAGKQVTVVKMRLNKLPYVSIENSL